MNSYQTQPIRDSCFRVKHLQTFYKIMEERGIEQDLSFLLYRKFKKLYPGKIYSGQKYTFYKSLDNKIIRFGLFSKDGLKRYQINKTDSNFSFEVNYETCIPKIDSIEGVLNASLYDAVIENKGSPELISNIADLYKWDINFFKDPRKGDKFKVIYENMHISPEKTICSHILAAVYENNGIKHYAFRFKCPGKDGTYGFYDEEGRSMHRRFLKAPLKYRRISSKFSLNRMHPILKYRRAHPGVDYAAPTGTPVYSTADGTVVHAKICGGYGKCIKIKHGNGYFTFYSHLSRYNRGIKSGTKVKQQQVIGFVGNTGLSTGSHLDYRIQVSGNYLNPLSIKSQHTKKIPDNQLNDFFIVRDFWMPRLNFIDTTVITQEQTL
ncbi:MAG: peptidoglycan DD-metalloendopeptidase family protein [bacterium]